MPHSTRRLPEDRRRAARTHSRRQDRQPLTAFAPAFWKGTGGRRRSMLPSPTADATRLTVLDRTSPQAKTPGTLVSSRYGSRIAATSARPSPCRLRSGRIRAHRARISAGSHSVSASAPMKTNRPSQSCRRTALLRSRMSMAVRCVSPWTAWTSEPQLDPDVGFPVQLLDQVVRHALLQGVAPDDQRHRARIAGEVDRRLTAEFPAPMRWMFSPLAAPASLRAAPK